MTPTHAVVVESYLLPVGEKLTMNPPPPAGRRAPLGAWNGRGGKRTERPGEAKQQPRGEAGLRLASTPPPQDVTRLSSAGDLEATGTSACRDGEAGARGGVQPQLCGPSVAEWSPQACLKDSQGPRVAWRWSEPGRSTNAGPAPP